MLQYLGLSDTSASEPAIVVQAVTPSGSSTVSQVTLGLASNVLTVTPTVTSGPSITAATFDLTSASYDTLTELVTALNALGYLNAQLASGDGTVPSTLISVDATPISANTLATITYDNPTTDGTVGLIDSLIPMVQAEFESYTGRVVDEASIDERYDGGWAGTITLRSAPVASVSAVTVYDADGDGTAVASTSYYLDGTAGVLHARSGIDAGYGYFEGDGPSRNRLPRYYWPGDLTKNVRVQYTGGWGSGEVPADLQMNAARRVADLVMDRRNSRLMQSDAMQGRTLTRANEEEVLRGYFGKWRRVW